MIEKKSSTEKIFNLNWGKTGEKFKFIWEIKWKVWKVIYRTAWSVILLKIIIIDFFKKEDWGELLLNSKKEFSQKVYIERYICT